MLRYKVIAGFLPKSGGRKKVYKPGFKQFGVF
jgi:hypothetical protein